MTHNTVTQFAKLAQTKTEILRTSPASFWVAAMMAGAYVGIGIILIFSVASSIEPAWQKLVMGASFGIALTLVVFAGAELFTGHTMYMVLGYLARLTTPVDLIKVWGTSWFFNLLGALILVGLFILGGGGTLLSDGAPLLNKVASYKMNSPAIQLLARAALCNWLVCLALWMAARTSSDSGKAIVIFWCLFAFIACGFEHSVANMTLLSIALLSDHPETVTMGGMAHNLLWVSFGNIIGGSVFVALGYWKASNSQRPDLKINPQNAPAQSSLTDAGS